MAAHIDRQWVNKEIDDFNRRIGDYASSRRVTPELNKAAFNTLAEKIAAHLRLKDRVGDILNHLERSTDDDNGKIHTTAMELVKELNPEAYARSMDRSKVESKKKQKSKSKTVKKLIGEDDGDDDEVAEENITVMVSIGEGDGDDDMKSFDIVAKPGKGRDVWARFQEYINKFEDPDVKDFWSN